MLSKTLPRLWVVLFLILWAILSPGKAEMKTVSTTGLSFSISFPETSSREPLDGRVLLLVSTDNTKEPRFQINEDLSTQQVFGTTVDGLKPGEEVLVDASAFGYPLSSLS